MVGASLTVTSVQKNIKFETTSNEAGNYNVTHLIPDHYNVRFEAPGFKVVESTGIPVYADEAARVDVKLQVGGAEEKLTVSAEDLPLMKTDRSDVATTFRREEKSKVCLCSTETSPAWNCSLPARRSTAGSIPRLKTRRAAFRSW